MYFKNPISKNEGSNEMSVNQTTQSAQVQHGPTLYDKPVTARCHEINDKLNVGWWDSHEQAQPK